MENQSPGELGQTRLEKKESLRFKAGSLPPDDIQFTTRGKIWTIVILVGITLALLFKVGEVLPPFIWAAVTAFIFNDPITGLTRRTGQPRWVWVLGIYILFFGLLTLVFITLIPSMTRQVRQFVDDIPAVRQQLNDYLNSTATVNLAGVQVSSETIQSILNNALDKLPEFAKGIGPEFLKGTFHIAIDFLVYLIVTLYLMLIGNRFIFGFINSLPLMFRREMMGLALRIDTVLGAYIKGQFILISIMAVASFIVLSIMQVRYSLFLAIMVGVLELIPFIGPYLAISICSAVTFFQPDHAFGLPAIAATLVVGVALFILRQLEDYLVIPNVIGRLVELHPLLVIFTIIVASALVGPMGLLLGVPVVAAIKIIVGYLFYKIVDADREKIFLPPGSDFNELMRVVDGSPGRRLLIRLENEGIPLGDEANLLKLQQVSFAKNIDLAFVNEDEKLSHKLRHFGFTTLELPQERFINKT